MFCLIYVMYNSITSQLLVFLYILTKSPEKRDVYCFLKKKSSNWDGVAIEHGLAWNVLI